MKKSRKSSVILFVVGVLMCCFAHLSMAGVTKEDKNKAKAILSNFKSKAKEWVTGYKKDLKKLQQDLKNGDKTIFEATEGAARAEGEALKSLLSEREDARNSCSQLKLFPGVLSKEAQVNQGISQEMLISLYAETFNKIDPIYEKSRAQITKIRVNQKAKRTLSTPVGDEYIVTNYTNNGVVRSFGGGESQHYQGTMKFTMEKSGCSHSGFLKTIFLFIFNNSFGLTHKANDVRGLKSISSVNTTLPSKVVIYPDPLSYATGATSAELKISGVSADPNAFQASFAPPEDHDNPYSAYTGNYKIVITDAGGKEYTIYTGLDSSHSPDFNTDAKREIKQDLKGVVVDALNFNKADTKVSIRKMKDLFKQAKEAIPTNFYEDLTEIIDSFHYNLNYTSLTLHDKACGIMFKYQIRFNADFDVNGKGLIGKYNANRMGLHNKFWKTLNSSVNSFIKSQSKNNFGFSATFPDTNNKIKAIPTAVSILPPAPQPNCFHITAMISYAPSEKGTLYIFGGGADKNQTAPVITIYDNDGVEVAQKESTLYGTNDNLGLWKCSVSSLPLGIYRVEAVQGAFKTVLSQCYIVGK